jgi:hypothetical protein
MTKQLDLPQTGPDVAGMLNRRASPANMACSVTRADKPI